MDHAPRQDAPCPASTPARSTALLLLALLATLLVQAWEPIRPLRVPMAVLLGALVTLRAFQHVMASGRRPSTLPLLLVVVVALLSGQQELLQGEDEVDWRAFSLIAAGPPALLLLLGLGALGRIALLAWLSGRFYTAPLARGSGLRLAIERSRRPAPEGLGRPAADPGNAGCGGGAPAPPRRSPPGGAARGGRGPS